PSWIYQRLWLPFIRRCDVAIANSANTARLAMSKGVLKDRLSVIHPGTDLHNPDAVSGLEFRRRYHLGEGLLLLSVGRMTPRKCLMEFVRDVFPLVLAEQPNAFLLIIGSDAKDALTTQPKSSRDRIIAAARDAG